jgi:enoyl-CoA hydratase
MDTLLLGEPISGQRAYDIDLVGHVTPHGGALARARELAELLAANGPLAVRNIKASVVENLEKTEAEAFLREQELGMAVMNSKDAKEGPRAFLEKRTPRFTGE